jgi:membrane-bound lytic murein transglycosylase D
LYKVKPGENLVSIAIKNHTTVSSIRLANHLKGNSLRTGMRLQIATETTSNKISLSKKVAKLKTVTSQAYVIKKSDTIVNISKHFSVTPKDITNWNNMKSNTALIPGRKLTIKSTNPQIASSTPSVRLINYTVKKGDSLSQISKKFNMTNAELLKSNAATLVKGLRPGLKLKLFIDNNQSAS